MTKPFSLACENNKQPILDVLRRIFADCRQVLEIGSGSGQHAIFFAQHLTHLRWQPSDLEENLNGIQQWMDEFPSPNLDAAVGLDMLVDNWPTSKFDAVFSANTAHIMPWKLTCKMLRSVAYRLPIKGVFALYGPFNYGGEYTSVSNEKFDMWLKSVDPARGIRHFEALDRVATMTGLQLVEDNSMPANNRLLVWQKGKT